MQWDRAKFFLAVAQSHKGTAGEDHQGASGCAIKGLGYQADKISYAVSQSKITIAEERILFFVLSSNEHSTSVQKVPRRKQKLQTNVT